MPTLAISTQFDSGSIEVVRLDGPDDIQLRIRCDNAAKFAQWFHFRLQGAGRARVTLRFLNAWECSYPGGWENYRVVASHDRRHWFRIATRYDETVMTAELTPDTESGYHRQPARTREAEWFDRQGKRFIRTGDIGRFDADGFLTLFDRKKDMLISGGFNVYPSDLEAVLRRHPAVFDVAVVGVPSRQWGETPAAFVVLQPGHQVSAGELLQWTNGQVGKTQRLGDLQFLDELPRSVIGKVLKRELRAAYTTKEHLK